MRIGVVSDTHSKGLPAQMVGDFKNTDMIFHVGDFCDIVDYDNLAKIKEVKAVCGNMDLGEITRRLPKKQVVQCGKFCVGLCHGGGATATLLERVREEFKGEKVDVIIFGHSHQPFNKKIDGVLYFNPGSPNDRIFAPYRSYGILEITEADITGNIIKVEESDE